jgi:hypothetical protein
MQYDQKLKDANIVAIGSRWSTVVGSKLVPYHSKTENLNFQRIEDKWDKGFLFMALK